MFKWILYIAVAYLFLFSCLYFFQRQFIYSPRSGSIRPEDWNLSTVKLIQLKTSDDLLLNAWFHPARNNETPTILYFHGNAGHIGHRADRVRGFVKAGYGVLLLSYRGYGGNKGSPSEENLYQDARAAIHFLHSKGVHTHCVVLFGESLGSGVAVQIATEFRVGAIILQSAYPSLVEVGQKHYSIFPVNLLLKDRFESINKVKKIQSPVLFIHGSNDFIVPIELGKKIYLVANVPKEIKIYPGSGHNDLPDITEVIIQFLEKHAICLQSPQK